MFDHFAAAANAEIDVDIRHRYAFGIEEAFEKEIVLQRIYSGDPQTPRNERPGGGTASWPYGNTALDSVLDELPDDKK
jgi:hypothetical protein